MNRSAILSPVSEREPCGPSLEYDHEFAMLFACMVPRSDAQYGSFVGKPEAINWAEVERDCLRLLLRTKDINLLVWLCRARVRQSEAAGLVQSLAVLSAVLQAWPEQVHPQLVIEGERDPAVRANAIAGLVDPEGLLGDVSEIVLSASTALRLTVREVDRAFTVPRPADALDPQGVTQQLKALRTAARGDPLAPIHCLAEAGAHLRAIEDWARSQLGEHAPSMLPLLRVLELFAAPEMPSPQVPQRPVRTPGEASEAPFVGRTGDRGEALLKIRAAREWFESHEPSSPVAVLLKQAERMVGKRFSQVADAIPLDLLRKWEDEEGTGGGTT